MAATERTYLTRPNDPPHYIEFAGIIRNRRNRIRQFQCCVCAFLLALFVISVVMTISYSISHTSTNNLTAATDSTINPEINLLKSAEWKLNPDDPPDDNDNNNNSPSLTDGETIQGIKAGNEAIENRKISDAYTKPLPSPSPNFRHQFAVSTSLEAGTLALAGVGEIAATIRIEESRSLHNKPSSFGSYFNGGWTSHGHCKKFKEIICKPSKYRTYDGTCNNRKQWGAAMTPYRRILPPAYADRINAPRRAISGKALPSAREVSLKVHPPSPSSNPAFTVMLAVYGQFLDHDITATAISQGINGSSLSCCSASLYHPECFPVKVGHGDPVYDIGKSSCMEFVRSAPASQCKIGPRQQLNQVTSFIDGSTIYGADHETINTLREFHGGRLKMQVTSDNRTLLPRSTNFNDGCNRKQEWKRGRYCFAAGDKRANENLHLTTMHILWARQHNRLANSLHTLNPSWNDERLFQESRRILGAQLQHITYNEFLPIVLGETLTNVKNLKPMKSGFRRVNHTVNPALANNFASAAFRFAHTLLPGLMKLTDSEKGTTSYIELHRMLFNPYSLYNEEGIAKSVTMATSNVIQKTSTHVTSQLTSHLFEDPASNKSLPCGLDLVSLNIQRGRDHGLPGYSKWRHHCGLPKAKKFSDLKDDLDPVALKEISKLYKSVDDVDLYTGALAEIPRSDGIVGPTFTCLIAEQFERSQQGDGFWYENSDHPGAFTEEQLQELRKTTLAKLICDCSDGITDIQAEVMKSEDGNNPIISCEDISEPSLEPWRETPNLSAGEPVEDSNWSIFKTDINKTVQNLADFIKGNEPSIPDDDYLQFQKEIDESFQNLKNELQGLRPSLNTNSLDSPSPTFDQDNISPESPTTSDLINLMLFMNNSLQEAKNQVSLLARKHPVHHDWEIFKSNITRVLNRSVDQLKEGSSSRDDWLAFKHKIKVEVSRIKTEVTDMKNQIAELKKNPKFQNFMDHDSDWQMLKNDVVKSIGEVVDVIEDNLPPSDDPNRGTFLQKVKSRFRRFNHRTIHHSEDNEKAEDDESAEKTGDENTEDGESTEDDENTEDENTEDENTEDKENTEDENREDANNSDEQFSLSHWRKTKRKAIKSLNEAISNIETNKPNWSHYRDEIEKKFSKRKYSSSSRNENREWKKFKHELKETLDKIIEEIRDKSPKPNDPSWPEYKEKIIDMLSKFRSDIPVKPPVLLTISENTVFDWKTYKSDINKSLCHLIDDRRSGNLLPNDTQWQEFREKFHKSMNDSKYRMSVLKLNFVENSKLDWINFRCDLKEAIENVVRYIKANSPPRGSPEWIEFRKEIRAKFSEIRREFDNRRDDILERGDEFKKMNHDELKDWKSLRDDINRTINTTLNRRKKSLCDSSWKFCHYIDRSFSEFKNNMTELSSKVQGKNLLKLSHDWSDFSHQINDSLKNALKNFNNIKLSKNLDWMNLRESIRNNIAQLKEEISKIKQEWSMRRNEENRIENISDLEKNTDQSFHDLKNQVEGLEVTGQFNITQEDWNDFKNTIKKTVNNYLDLLKETNSQEWMNFKNFLKNSIDDLKEQIVELKKNIEESIEKIKIENSNGTSIESNNNNNSNKTIEGILNNLNNSSIINSNLNKVKEALVRARDQILRLSYNDSKSTENISKWKKYQDSVKDHFNELNEAMKNKTNPINDTKSSSSKLTASSIATASILILILVRLEISF